MPPAGWWRSEDNARESSTHALGARWDDASIPRLQHERRRKRLVIYAYQYVPCEPHRLVPVSVHHHRHLHFQCIAILPLFCPSPLLVVDDDGGVCIPPSFGSYHTLVGSYGKSNGDSSMSSNFGM